MRNVNVTLKADLLLRLDDDADIDPIVNEMDYNFASTDPKGDIEDTNILDYEVTDSR